MSGMRDSPSDPSTGLTAGQRPEGKRGGHHRRQRTGIRAPRQTSRARRYVSPEGSAKGRLGRRAQRRVTEDQCRISHAVDRSSFFGRPHPPFPDGENRSPHLTPHPPRPPQGAPVGGPVIGGVGLRPVQSSRDHLVEAVHETLVTRARLHRTVPMVSTPDSHGEQPRPVGSVGAPYTQALGEPGGPPGSARSPRSRFILRPPSSTSTPEIPGFRTSVAFRYPANTNRNYQVRPGTLSSSRKEKSLCQIRSCDPPTRPVAYGKGDEDWTVEHRFRAVAEVLDGVAEPPGLGGEAEHGLHHRQCDQFGGGELRGDSHGRTPWREMRRRLQQVVGLHMECDCEGANSVFTH